jgi:hypothetical protein
MFLVLVADLDIHVLESLDTGLEEFELRSNGEHFSSPRTNGRFPGKYGQRWNSSRNRKPMENSHVRTIKAHLRREEAKSFQGWKVC